MKYEIDLSQNANILTVTVPGDLLSTTVEGIRQDFSAVLEEPAVKRVQVKLVEFDLSEAKMMDSAGLNLLVSFVKLGRGLGFKVRVLVTSPTLLRVLQFTRIDKLVDIVANVPAAAA
jgi:anti-anti-sigma factor